MWFYKKKLKTKHGIWNSCEGETPITSFSSVLKRERLLFMCSIQSRWSWAIYKIAQWYVVSMMKWRLRVWLPALAIFPFWFFFAIRASPRGTMWLVATVARGSCRRRSMCGMLIKSLMHHILSIFSSEKLYFRVTQFVRIHGASASTTTTRITHHHRLSLGS